MKKIDLSLNPNNPSADDIVKAFVHAFDPDGSVLVPFHQVEEHDNKDGFRLINAKLTLQVTSLAYESGKPEPGGFLVGGNVVVNGKCVGSAKGFYDANRKTGYLDIE